MLLKMEVYLVRNAIKIKKFCVSITAKSNITSNNK